MSWPLAVGMIGAGALAGLGGFFGARETNRANRQIAQSANDQNQANAREQMAFQQQNSNTAHFRAVQDMKASGINPILAYANPASTPTGAMGVAQQGAPAVDEIGSAMQGVSTAMELKKLHEETNQTVASTKGIKATENQTKAQTELTKQQYNESQAKTLESMMRASQSQQYTQLLKQTTRSAQYKADFDETRIPHIMQALGGLATGATGIYAASKLLKDIGKGIPKKSHTFGRPRPKPMYNQKATQDKALIPLGSNFLSSHRK